MPTHFDASGKPNAYGSPVGIAIPCIIMTIAGVGLMVLAYFPRFINMPVKITNIHQVELTIRSTRIAAITLLLLALATVYTMLGMPTPSPIPILAAIGLLFLEIIVFSILIYKVRRKEPSSRVLRMPAARNTSGRPTPNSGDVTHQYFSPSYAPSTVRLIE